MSDIKLDSNGDIDLSTNALQLTTGIDAIVQHLKQRLRTFYGEWFRDRRIGVPYFEQILIKNPNPNVIDSIFKRAILDTPGIISLVTIDIDFEPTTRTMTLNFEAKSTAGVIKFNEVIP